tara:strand:+ start:125 stop:778 length:654 start_codon:yes stop_codon:yes gene_type:complete
MQTAITRLTELEAVNRILSSVGAEKVSALTNLSLIADSAYTQLRDSLRDLQSHPWGFNTEYEVEFTAADSKITIADSDYIAAIDLDPRHAQNLDVVLRDDAGTQRLWDRKTHTFAAFTSGSVYKATVTYYLQYEDCPEIVKIFVMSMAAVNFQASQVGNGQVDAILRQNLATAKAAFMSYESAQESWSIWDNYDFFKVVSGEQRPNIGSGAAWWGTR